MSKSLDNYLIDTMILIPEGTELIRRFRDENKWLSSDSRMSIPSKGANQKQTEKKVVIKPFSMAKYPVTKQIYNLVTNITYENDPNSSKPKVDISWYEAVSFCNLFSQFLGLDEYYVLSAPDSDVTYNPDSKGFRLPSDAEWQYASRADSKKYQYSDIDAIAWYKNNSNNEIHNVGEKEPNHWGLYDMLGNVWEWCWDYYNQESYASYRVFRGGSFAEEGRVCGSTTRRKSHPSYAIDDLGFRLVRSV